MHWKSMRQAEVGDVILHYSNQYIVALSNVIAPAVEANNPFNGDDTWGEHGKQIAVDIEWLKNPIASADIPLEIRKLSSAKGEPFQHDGNRVKQGYFFRVPPVLWEAIKALVSESDQTLLSLPAKSL